MSRLAAVLAVLASLLLSPASIIAQGEPQLRNSVTDEAGVVSAAEERQVAEALVTLRSEHGVQLFVLFVDTTGDATATEFAQATAEQNSLGGNDALLLVAITDRSDALWVADALVNVTGEEIDAILVDALEPRLQDGDFAGAAIDAAAALGRAAASVPATAAPETEAPVTAAPVPTPVPGGTTPGSRGIDVTLVLAIVLLAGGGLVLLRTMQARRSGPQAAGAGARGGAARGDPLSSQANRALLDADEALKDAEDEIGQAAAQWGEAEVQSYRTAIATAGDELRTAFAIRQRLDDAEPETPPERDAMLREIIQRTGAAKAGLDAQTEHIAALRDLERTAPDQLAALPASISAAQAGRAAAAVTMDRLARTYAPTAVESVRGNLEEAAKALATAVAETERGRAIPQAAPTAAKDAAIACRHAQESVASAVRLVDGIERLATRLDETAARVPAEIAAAEADAEAVRHAAGAGGPPPAVPGTAAPAAAVAEVERLLAEARAAAATPMDPLLALERATGANRAADALLAGIRAAEEAQRRRLEATQSAIVSARGRLDRAVDYITTRRHGVGQQARTRAAEAEARLAEAIRLAQTDPDAAIAAAQRAQQLADEAYRLAASEFDQWDAGRGPVAGPYRRDPVPSPGSEVLGSILGAVIGGMIAGGARGRGSGWGGSPWGGPGGGSHGGGFGLPSGPSGPFGGGGGGSGDGGGGGRVRGGRW